MKTYEELKKCERPEYKLEKRGSKSLKDEELLQLILNAGEDNEDNEDIRRVSKKIVSGKYQLAYEALQEIRRRATKNDGYKITSPEHAYELLKHDIANQKQEHFVVVTIDGSSTVINQRTIFIGTLNQSLVHPREVFADAIEDRAAGIIIAHNHPSGALSASRADIAITQRLNEVAKLVGIELLDHVIVSRDGYYSMSDEGLL